MQSAVYLLGAMAWTAAVFSVVCVWHCWYNWLEHLLLGHGGRRPSSPWSRRRLPERNAAGVGEVSSFGQVRVARRGSVARTRRHRAPGSRSALDRERSGSLSPASGSTGEDSDVQLATLTAVWV